uniref:Uncharacterized protein n=1 Tax=Solanum tuberosum TaxID=4113 RepID=M1DXX3_SOLTU
MDSGSEKLTSSLKNGGKRVGVSWGSFFSSKSRKMHNKVLYGFINDFKSRRACHNDPHPAATAPPRRLVRTSELFKEFQNPHFTTHHHPMTLRKYPFTLRSVSGVLLTQIQFRKVVRDP